MSASKPRWSSYLRANERPISQSLHMWSERVWKVWGLAFEWRFKRSPSSGGIHTKSAYRIGWNSFQFSQPYTHCSSETSESRVSFQAHKWVRTYPLDLPPENVVSFHILHRRIEKLHSYQPTLHRMEPTLLVSRILSPTDRSQEC